MRPLRPILDRPLHHDGDPYDDGPLPDLTSGLMWMATGVVGIAVQPLPGTDRDEFALIAPGAGDRGVLRLMRALGEAIHAIHLPGVGTVRVTFAWAAAPDDAPDPDDLMRAADERLMERRRGRRRREALAFAV